MTRPFGALRGLVRLTSSKPAVGLTFWKTSMDDADWQGQIAPFDFVTFKVANGTTVLSDKELGPVYTAAQAAGVPVQTWTYNNLRSREEANNEGIVAAEQALRYGAKAHWVNAESQWSGGYSGQAGAPDPYSSMEAFVYAFRTTAPHVRLVFNSTTSWISPRLTPALDRKIAALFDVYGPMVYSSGSQGGVKTMRKKWERGRAVATELGIPFAPMMGSGRQDRKTGSYWTNIPELAALQDEMPADWVTFWMAPTYLDRIYAGNPLNPSLQDFKGAMA